MSKKDTRYVMIGGFAFSEQTDMTKLQKLAEEGWQLEGISFGLWFRLKRAEPEQVEYNMDYREDADEEYFEYFTAAGWQHVLSLEHVHIFKAPRGTRPLYTDRQTTQDKYIVEKRRFGKYSLLTFPLVVLALFSLGCFERSLLHAAFVWLLILPFVFSFVPYLGFVLQLARLKKTS